MTTYEELAQKHNVSVEAVEVLAQALISSRQLARAKWHSSIILNLGGMGQWMPGYGNDWL